MSHSTLRSHSDSPLTDLEPTSPVNQPEESQNNSPLYLSLLHSLKNPNTISTDWLNTIAEKNNPRTINKAAFNDSAQYWVDNNDNILRISFPAILDPNGKYSRVGAYLSMDNQVPKVNPFAQVICDHSTTN